MEKDLEQLAEKFIAEDLPEMQDGPGKEELRKVLAAFAGSLSLSPRSRRAGEAMQQELLFQTHLKDHAQRAGVVKDLVNEWDASLKEEGEQQQAGTEPSSTGT